MKVTEFLQGRDVERQAVTRYINRHEDLFEGHIQKVGKEIELDAFAVEELGKVYPLLKPVMVIDGVPQEELIRVQQELIKKQNELESLQGRILEMSRLVAMAEAKELLLEDRTRQLEALQEKEEATAQELRELREAKEQELRELREDKEQEIAELREALEQERSKTWLQKLFGK